MHFQLIDSSSSSSNSISYGLTLVFLFLYFVFIQRHPTITPPTYPQIQAPIVNNPAFWEKVGQEPFGTDTLFFAFYYQQVSELSV